MLYTRTRIVNFRVSEKELQRLRMIAAEHGARSLSDYAREVMLRALKTEESPAGADDWVRAMDSRLSRLEEGLHCLENALFHQGAMQNGTND